MIFSSLVNTFNRARFDRNIDCFTLLPCHVEIMRLPRGLWATGHEIRRQRGALAQQQLALHRHNNNSLTYEACCHHRQGFSAFISSYLGLSDNFPVKNILHVAYTFETHATTGESKLWFCIRTGIVPTTKYPRLFLTTNNKLA